MNPIESQQCRLWITLAWLALMAAASSAPLPSMETSVPTDLVGFCRWTVQDRAAGGLNRVVTDEQNPKYGTVYGGNSEDANIAWVAAAAYRHDWSRFHGDDTLREKASFLLDSLAERRADGRWDDGGLGAYFGLHSFAWAVLSWTDAADFEPERKARWVNAVGAAADDAMATMAQNLCVGQYANPEFYYLSGLAAAWKLTGTLRYRLEARRALERYERALAPGGGLPYFHRTAPQHGYQQMVSKSVVLYWMATADPYGLEWLRRLSPYFVTVQHPSGLVPDAEQPWLKHAFYNPVNPAVPGMFAAVLGDGGNRTAAETAARCRADNVAGRLPSFLESNPNWYNYHHTTYAATLLRLLEDRDLPEPEPLPSRRILRDHAFSGVRSHWDSFTAAVGMRPKNDSLAGAYLADPDEPMMPLHCGVDGVVAAVLEGDRSEHASASARQRAVYRCIDPEPGLHYVETAELCAASARGNLCSPHWNDLPWRPGERWDLDEIAEWSQIQHWAVWQDHLIGFVSLRCHQSGGNPDTDDQVRIHLRIAPPGKERTIAEDDGQTLMLSYGAMSIRMQVLDQKGGFSMSVADWPEAPSSAHASWAPAVRRQAPWETGDYVAVAIDIAPVSSQGTVSFVPLGEGAAAICAGSDSSRAVVWTASLTRHFRQLQMDVQPGMEVQIVERSVALTPPRDLATFSLHGGESAVALIEATDGIDPERIAASLRPGWGRGESRPQRTR